MKIIKSLVTWVIFLLLIILGGYYIFFLKTEKYQSDAIIVIKNLSFQQDVDKPSLSALLTQASTGSKDARLLEVYIRSFDMFNSINKKFDLKDYYTSDTIDFIQRLYKDANNSFYKKYHLATNENLLEYYNKDLEVNYDDLSGTLKISFADASPVKAQKIVKEIIKNAANALNYFEKENSEVTLKYIREQVKEHKKRYVNAMQKVISYQNKSGFIDPSSRAESISALIASLEADLIKKKIEYKSKLKIYDKNFPQMKAINSSIVSLQSNVNRLKSKLTSVSKKSLKGRKKLNKNVYDFTVLKSNLKFAQDLYTKSLTQLELMKIKVQQNSKNIIVISNPTLPQEYKYPEKIKEFLTLFIIITFFFIIIKSFITIIKDHVD